MLDVCGYITYNLHTYSVRASNVTQEVARRKRCFGERHSILSFFGRYSESSAQAVAVMAPLRRGQPCLTVVPPVICASSAAPCPVLPAGWWGRLGAAAAGWAPSYAACRPQAGAAGAHRVLCRPAPPAVFCCTADDTMVVMVSKPTCGLIHACRGGERAPFCPLFRSVALSSVVAFRPPRYAARRGALSPHAGALRGPGMPLAASILLLGCLGAQKDGKEPVA